MVWLALYSSLVSCELVDFAEEIWYHNFTENMGDEVMTDTEIWNTEKEFEKLHSIIQQFRLIDDIFFEKVMEDKEAFEEVIRVILEDSGLIIEEVNLQEPIHNLQGRSVRLDALCKKSDGNYINIEVQRANNDNHFKRVRYNASCITANITEPGEKFKNVKDICVVFISEFDIFKRGKTIYHTRQVVQETEKEEDPVYVDDGFSSIYVNTEINDNTDIAELMNCFLQTKVKNSKFPKLSNRVTQLKESEEGVDGMNVLLEQYAEKWKMEGIEEGKKEGKKEGIEEGEKIGRAKEIIRMSRKFNIADNKIQEELRNTLQISQEAAKRYMEKYKEVN